MNVLVISDLPATQRSVQQILAADGIDCEATGSKDAVKSLQENPEVSLVICEWQLSGATAMGIRRESDAIERVTDTATLPPPAFVILLTPQKGGSEAERQKMLRGILNMGFVGVIKKPINRVELTSLVQQRLADSPPSATVGGRDVDAETSGSTSAPAVEPDIVEARATLARVAGQLAEIGQQIKSLERACQS